MPLLPYQGQYPTVAPNVFIAPNAYIIGEVTIGEGCSIWFAVTVRGDTGPVRIGEGTNVQDGSTIHSQQGFETFIESDVVIGHHVVVHAAEIGRRTLIGIGASVLTGARVGEGSIVASHSLVTEGASLPSGSLALGVPARRIRDVTDAEYGRIDKNLATYRKLGSDYSRALTQFPQHEHAQ